MAIAPLAVTPSRLRRLLPFRSLEFLGTGSVGSDYLDVIVRRGEEPEASEALAGYLAGGKLMLELTQINQRSCAATSLATRLRERGWRVSETTTDVCPFITLSGHSWHSYLGTLGAKQRYNAESRIKNLDKQFEVRFEQATSEEQRREFLSLLLALHHRRWRERGGSTAFHTPGLLAFHEEVSRLALERGWLRLFVLRLDGGSAAAFYGFRYGRAFYFYQSGFDPCYAKHGVGQATVSLTIKHAIEEDAEEYDLLHGDESYKFSWTRDVRELGRVELYPPRVRGLLLQRAIGLSRLARKMGRRVLPRVVIEWMTAGGEDGFFSKHQAATPR